MKRSRAVRVLLLIIATGTVFSVSAQQDKENNQRQIAEEKNTVQSLKPVQRRLPVPDENTASATTTNEGAAGIGNKAGKQAEIFRQQLEKSGSSRTSGGIEEKRIYETDGRPVSQVKTPYGTYCVRHRKPGEPDHLKPPSVPGKCP
jgi:hypothetical protein